MPIEERVRQASLDRRSDERDNTRAKILESAAHLMVADGYDAFSMRKVGERAGFTATTIYRYFKDRDELVFTVADEAFREFGRRLEAAAATETDPMAQIQAIGRAYVQFGIERPVHYRLMFIQRPDYLVSCPPNSQEIRLASFNTLRDAVARLVASGRATTAEVELTSHTLWAGVHGIVCLALSLDWLDQDIVDAMTAQLEGFFEAGLVRR
jgi:AcrR family transcriptional regulator